MSTMTCKLFGVPQILKDGQPVFLPYSKINALLYYILVLLAVVILYLAGVDQWICIPFGTVSGGLLAWAVFRLNARYGEHGLMKLLAEKRHPRYLIHRKRVFRLFAKRKKRQS